MSKATNTLQLLERTFHSMLERGSPLRPSQRSSLALALIALKFLADSLQSQANELNSPSTGRIRFDWSRARSPVFGRTDDVMSLARDVEGALPWAREIFTSLLLRDLDQLTEPVLSDWLYWLGRVRLTDREETGHTSFEHTSFLDWLDEKLDEDTEGWASAEHGTPRSIARLMVKLANLTGDERVLDPRAGNGALLAEAAAATARQADGDDDDDEYFVPRLFGQEPRRVLWAWAMLRLALAEGSQDESSGEPRARIVCQDSLWNPAFTIDGRLSRFDVVLCDVPFGKSQADAGFAAQDYYKRFELSASERLSLEIALIQHVLASLDDGGRAILLVTPGFLYRQGPDERLRRRLLKQGLIKAVVGLPPKMFWPQTTFEAAIVVLDKNRRLWDQVEGDVTFVDAAQIGPRPRGRMLLTDEMIDRIAISVRRASSDSDYGIACRTVASDEILKHRLSLQPGRHARPLEDARDMEGKLVDARIALEDASHRYKESSEKFDALLRRLTDDERQEPN